MSQQLISHSPELKKLRDEGYNVSIVANHLVIDDVPYVTPTRQVRVGKLVTDLVINGNCVSGMGSHVAYFVGDFPCDQQGRPITKIQHASQRQERAPGLIVEHSFSSKPVGGRKYDDYYHKMTTYIGIIAGPALEIEPSRDPRTFRPISVSEEESVFCYCDTATSRAGLGVLAEKISSPSVAIIGLGGTGSYILDHVAKTPVRHIHLFDGDVFCNHNAFRSPGAASFQELDARPSKVAYYQELYSKMRRGIHAHEQRVDESNINKLRQMAFVFICIDDGPSRKWISENLQRYDVSFIDVGMGVNLAEDGSLFGTLRVTTSSSEMRECIEAGRRIPYDDGEAENLYTTNIQTSELNCLNACLAIIRWKKLMGFYFDSENEHHSLYSVGGNTLINEDFGPCPISVLRTAS